jgi:serine phosphatase RsbU (regulator of sigma subunit)
MAFLTVISGPNYGRVYALNRDHCLLGRQPDCHIYDLFEDDTAVSRKHAKIAWQEGQYYVEDLKSQNGTLLNGRPVDRPLQLSDGDQLAICRVHFQFRRGSPSPADQIDVAATACTRFLDDPPSQYIQSKVSLSSSSLMNRSLEANAEVRVKALLGLLAKMSQSLELGAMLGNVLDALMQVFPHADRGFVGLQLKSDGPLTPAAVRHRGTKASTAIQVSRSIVEQVMAAREAILSTDAMDDPRFADSGSVANAKIRSVMCAPLIDTQNKVLGVVQIDSLHAGHAFQPEDLQLLADVAPQAVLAVQVWQLHQQSLKQAAMQRDLELAAQVQASLLPTGPPQVPKYEFFAFYRSAQKVGGDYYDYVELPDGRLAIAVADVSGKGIAAALIMAELMGELKCLLTSEPTAADVVRRVNISAARRGTGEKFITLVLAVLDPKEHQVTLVNAGHMDPLWRHANGTVEPVGAPYRRTALGIKEDEVYEEFRFQLLPGDSLTLFTDGITEAHIDGREMYREARLREALQRATGSVEEIGQAVLDDLAALVGSQDQSDDICLVCFGRSTAGTTIVTSRSAQTIQQRKRVRNQT